MILLVWRMMRGMWSWTGQLYTLCLGYTERREQLAWSRKRKGRVLVPEEEPMKRFVLLALFSIRKHSSQTFQFIPCYYFRWVLFSEPLLDWKIPISMFASQGSPATANFR